MTLIVCPLSHVEAVVAERRPSHVITLLDPTSLIGCLEGYQPERHLRLGVHDIPEPAEGMIPPDADTVRAILDFGATWDQAQPLLVHCWAGVSRSTATAFVLACERNPEVRERDIAFALRQASRTACPNRRIVALADDMLGRGGRMVDAAAWIGRGEACWEGRPFDLPARWPTEAA
ncbi:MAG TPA: hypothetical protein VF699_06175 [Caulobacteraceae bacterium]